VIPPADGPMASLPARLPPPDKRDMRTMPPRSTREGLPKEAGHSSMAAKRRTRVLTWMAVGGVGAVMGMSLHYVVLAEDPAMSTQEVHEPLLVRPRATPVTLGDVAGLKTLGTLGRALRCWHNEFHVASEEWCSTAEQELYSQFSGLELQDLQMLHDVLVEELRVKQDAAFDGLWREGLASHDLVDGGWQPDTLGVPRWWITRSKYVPRDGQLVRERAALDPELHEEVYSKRNQLFILGWMARGLGFDLLSDLRMVLPPKAG
jgi:hypothetical protein